MEFNNLKDAMNAEVGFWDFLPTLFSSSFIWLIILGALFMGVFVLAFMIDIMSSSNVKSISISVVSFVVAFGFLSFTGYIAGSESSLHDEQDDYAVQHIEDNYDVRNVVITDTDREDGLYQVEVSFDHKDSAYKYESKLSYNDNYGVMVPVVHADYDMMPFKDGSNVAELLENTDELSYR